MKGLSGKKWMLGGLSLVLVFAMGCAKKEMVKSTEAGQGAAASAPAPPSSKPEGIATETMKPETPAKPPEMAGSQMAMAGIAATQEKPSSFEDIHFDFDKSFIRDDAKPVLQSVAEYLKKNPGASMVIEGNCDERGTAEYNMALGERRATSAKNYLISLGVKSGALSTVSFGEEKPIDPGHNEAAWAKNRRDHFVLR
jgi:peptidoglycan-associated lipoprotein